MTPYQEDKLIKILEEISGSLSSICGMIFFITVIIFVKGCMS